MVTLGYWVVMSLGVFLGMYKVRGNRCVLQDLENSDSFINYSGWKCFLLRLGLSCLTLIVLGQFYSSATNADFGICRTFEFSLFIKLWNIR